MCSLEPRRASVAARARRALERVSGDGRGRRCGRFGSGHLVGRVAQAARVGHVALVARGPWPRPAGRHGGEPRRQRCCALGRARRRRHHRRRADQRSRATVPRRRQPLRPPAPPRFPCLLGVCILLVYEEFVILLYDETILFLEITVLEQKKISFLNFYCRSMKLLPSFKSI